MGSLSAPPKWLLPTAAFCLLSFRCVVLSCSGPKASLPTLILFHFIFQSASPSSNNYLLNPHPPHKHRHTSQPVYSSGPHFLFRLALLTSPSHDYLGTLTTRVNIFLRHQFHVTQVCIMQPGYIAYRTMCEAVMGNRTRKAEFCRRRWSSRGSRKKRQKERQQDFWGSWRLSILLPGPQFSRPQI